MSVREGLPGPEGWGIWRRHVHTGDLKTSLSHAPPDTPLTTLVRMSGMRWPIETCCEDGKPYLAWVMMTCARGEVASAYDLVHAGSLLLGSAPVSVEKKAPP